MSDVISFYNNIRRTFTVLLVHKETSFDFISISMRHISYINGLKGIAALLVLVSHMAFCFNPAGPLIHLWNHSCINIMNSDFAVHIFIMISAYLAYVGFEKGKPIDDLLLKRYFRLSLPVACILVIMGVLKALGLFYCDIEDLPLSTDWLIGESRNYSDLPKVILMSPFGMYYGWMNPLWMMKYVFFAPFIVYLLNSALMQVHSIGKVLLLVLTGLLFIRYDYYFVDIILGYIFAGYGDLSLTKSKTMKNTICIVSLFALLALEFADFFYVNICRGIMVLLLCANSTFFQLLIGCKLLNWIGHISMGIYIVHVPVLCTVGSFLLLPMNNYSFLFTELATFICTMIMAALYTNYIERYSTKLINWGLVIIKGNNK